MQRPQPEIITLDEILITAELSRRVPRPANLQAENQAMRSLIHQLAQDSETLLQTLVEIALELCQAGTAGVSLIETINQEEAFRWSKLAGRMTHDDLIPRDFSPCGICVDRGTPQLFKYPEHYFTYLQGEIPIVEALLLPLIADEQAIGAIWIMSHDEARHFDSEDVRLMTSLSDFPATALLLNQRQTGELLAANVRLETEIAERKQTEAQLSEAQRRLELSLRGADLGTWTYTIGTDEFWADDRALQMHAHAPGEIQTFVDAGVHIHPEDRDRASAAFAQTIQNRSNLQVEYRVIWRNESIHWVASYAEFVPGINPDDGIFYGIVQDITAAKRDQLERDQSEARLQVMIENLPGGAAFIVDRDLRYVLAEGEALAIAGFKPEDLVGKTISEAIPPELVANYEALYRTGLAGEPFELEHNAHDRCYISRGTPLRSANGEVYAVLAVSYDITDRKRVEATLAADLQDTELLHNLSERFVTQDDIQALYQEIVTTAIALTRADAGTVQILDDATQDLLLLATQGFEQNVTDHFYRVNASSNTSCGRALAMGDRTFIDFDVPQSEDPDGSLQLHVEAGYLLAQSTPLIARSGKAIGMVSTHWRTHHRPSNRELRFLDLLARQAADLIDHRQAEAQLRRAAEMDAFRVTLSDALRSLSDAVEIQATVTRITMDSFRADRCYYCEIIDGSAIIRRDASQADLPSVAGAYPLESSPIFRTMLDAGQPFVFEDVHTTNVLDENLRQTNLQLQILAALMIPVIKQGEPVGILCVTQTTPRNWTKFEIDLAEEIADRTWATIERTRVEANLREAELQRVREQSAREQEQQRAESLAELDRAKTLFFSNVSHEFRTPLTLLLSPLQEVLRDRSLPSTHREPLELAHRNSLRLLKLVNTLLDFSRIESGRIEAVYEPTDLSQFTAELASVFRSAIEQAGLQFIVDCPPLAESVYVDRDLWEKIVLNLISNAFKFTLAGEITIRLYLVDRQVVLEVQDTGTGIASEELPHLFERFYQVRSTAARTHEGSGIGLALVHELVQLQGGTIAVSSTVGKGSCFTITLPLGCDHLPHDRIQVTRSLTSTAVGKTPYVQEAELWRSESADFSLRAQAPSSIPSNAQVLLVDDNADMRDYLTRILSEHVEVRAFADGTSALLAAQTQIPDLILSDVMMPGLDGFQLLQALRSDARTREIPIILLSARAGEEAIVEGLEAGADDYLIKPFSAQELVSRVNAHLQMAHLRQEALNEARTTIRRRDELFSTVSHELNTPLVSILGWTRLLRSSPPSPAMLNKALDTIERNATLQATLVQDMLDMSRISAGKLHLQLHPIELATLVETAIATVTQSAITKGIHLVQQEIDSTLIVIGDRDRLQQVLCNLLTNAIKFTPAEGSVRVELRTDSECAEIRIIDTGIGISAESLPHIFDRFWQAGTSEKGLGLGLAIAHHIIELHSGTIAAESTGEGQGATFIVRLPIHSDRMRLPFP